MTELQEKAKKEGIIRVEEPRQTLQSHEPFAVGNVFYVAT